MHRDLIDDVARAILRAGPGSGADEVWAEAAGDPSAYTRSGSPAHFTASALPVTADGRRVCLVLHGRVGLWVQPGGHLEEGDMSVARAAGRELLEETGLAGDIGDEPLLLSRHPAPCGMAEWHLDLQMMAIVAEAEPVVSHESVAVAWFGTDRLPADLAPGVAGLVAKGVARLRRSGSPGPSGPQG